MQKWQRSEESEEAALRGSSAWDVGTSAQEGLSKAWQQACQRVQETQHGAKETLARARGKQQEAEGLRPS